MAKVYLVYAQGCTPTGSLDVNSKKYVVKVFTNKKLADKCAEYFNQNWHLGFKRNADFKKEFIEFYYVMTEVISKNDYSKLPF